jgi:hypothetical protein
LVLEKILEDVQCILTLCCYFPFKKGIAPYSNNFESHLPKDVLFQHWLRLACVSGEEFKNVKVRQTMHNVRSEKLTSPFSSSELK